MPERPRPQTSECDRRALAEAKAAGQLTRVWHCLTCGETTYDKGGTEIIGE
jgi:hypothetical protein